MDAPEQLRGSVRGPTIRDTIKGLLGPRRELLYQSSYIKADIYTGENSWVQEEGQ